jgi:hypothetical protein
MHILHLVLYSPNEHYDKMYHITRRYYNTFNNIKTIYYHYSPDQSEEFILQDNILKIKGEEKYGPSITVKTIKAFEYFDKDILSCDYVVRSNISTIVNFNLLQNHLQINAMDYGGHVLNLQWFDGSSGITTTELWGLNYVSGITIIMSSFFVKHMMDHSSFIRTDIVDDVSIGEYAKQIGIAPTNLGNRILFVPNYSGNQIEIERMMNENKDHIVLYRNRTHESRHIDVVQMIHIFAFLLKSLS